MNWHDIQKLETLQLQLKKLGYVMGHSKYSSSGSYTIGVYPLNDQLPIYSRDAELFSGDTESIAIWIRGIQHRNDYLHMLKATTDEKIKCLEEKYINSRIQKGMLEKIKNPDKKLDKHTSDLIELRAK
jgi:hypothetical protein